MTTTQTTVTVTWSDNEGNHANKPFRAVREQAIAACRAKGLPDAGNNVGYEAHQIMLSRARAALSRVSTCTRDGIETSDYVGDETAIRKICEQDPAIAGYAVQE